jgi:hypothetical protein
MTMQTLHLIDEYLTQGGYTPGIDAETLDREAALVAAAPDLLAALEAAYRHFLQHMERDWFDDDDHDAMQKMFDAIAKAKGA